MRPRGGRPRDYPNEIVTLVRGMYAAGHTVREIDLALGAGFKAQRLVERFVEQRRPAIPRDQTGERNGYWQGGHDRTAQHDRVRRLRGRPSECYECGRTDGRFEWANLTGRYHDVNDYTRLCPGCHRRYDALRRRLTGELTAPPRGDVKC